MMRVLTEEVKSIPQHNKWLSVIVDMSRFRLVFWRSNTEYYENCDKNVTGEWGS